LLVKAWGAGFTPGHAKQILIGSLLISTAGTVATWDTYDDGFWDQGGLLTIKGLTHDFYPELEAMRTQPTDVHVHDVNEFTDDRGWSEDGIVPTTAWLDWSIYQPARYIITDFTDSNGHQNAEFGINAAAGSTSFNGGDGWATTGSFTVTEDLNHFPDGHHESVETITTDLACEYRASERKINDINTVEMISSTLTLTDSNGKILNSFDDCAGATTELKVGEYSYEYIVTVEGALAYNDSIVTETSFQIASFQPLLVWTEDAPAAMAGRTVDLTNDSQMAAGGTDYASIENPTYHYKP
jgi:hypothetical protein